MAGKIPPNAFDFYAGLGSGRSYAIVAEKYGVTKRAVFKRARAENWRRRLEELEDRARETAEKKTIETLAEMNARHLRAMRVIQGKALQALQTLSIEDAMDAVRALDLATRNERVIRGEPVERTAVNIEEVVRREYANWLIVPAKAVDVREVAADETRRESEEKAKRGGRKLLAHEGRADAVRANDSDDGDANAQQGGALP